MSFPIIFISLEVIYLKSGQSDTKRPEICRHATVIYDKNCINDLENLYPWDEKKCMYHLRQYKEIPSAFMREICILPNFTGKKSMFIDSISTSARSDLFV